MAYKVPVNQRDYWWTAEEIDTLWQDLTSAIDDGRGEYFLGAVVLAPHDKDERTLEIVDGQQRLATVTMIFSAIRWAWENMGDADRAADVRSHYLGSRDRRIKETIPKLSLNEVNDPVFQCAVIDSRSEIDKRTLAKSNRSLMDGLERIRRALQRRIEETGNAKETLVELEDTSPQR